METVFLWTALLLAAIIYGGFDREHIRENYRSVRQKYKLLKRGIRDLFGK